MPEPGADHIPEHAAATSAAEPLEAITHQRPEQEPEAGFEPAAADERLLAAHDLARAALLEITPEPSIGPVVGHVVEGEHVLSLLFDCTLPGYPGWRWTVSLARVDEQSDPVVLEAELLPGEKALLAPDWVPWSERLAEYQAAQEAARSAADTGETPSGDAESADDSDDESDDDLDDFDRDDEYDGIDIDLHDADETEDDVDGRAVGAEGPDEPEAVDDIDVEAEDIAGAESASLREADVDDE